MLFFRRSKGKPVSSSGSSDSASDSDGLSNSFQRKGQRKIAVEYWDNVDREQVEKLPEGINGVKVFVVKNVDKKKDSRNVERWPSLEKELSYSLARTLKGQIFGLQGFLPLRK